MTTITHRVTQLRQQSLAAVPTLASERAELMTEFYQTHTGLIDDVCSCTARTCFPVPDGTQNHLHPPR